LEESAEFHLFESVEIITSLTLVNRYEIRQREGEVKRIHQFGSNGAKLVWGVGRMQKRGNGLRK
jgi:hypothetical protein